MKKFLIIGFAILACVSLINCDDAKEALDVSFSRDISTTLSIASATTNEANYNILLNAELDPEIQKYADNIKSYEITKLMIGIENYNSPLEDEIYFNGSLGFGKKSSTSPESSCPISNLPITNYAGTGNFEINGCNNLLNSIAGMMKDENSVRVFLIGATSKAPVYFDVKIIATVKVTANPL